MSKEKLIVMVIIGSIFSILVYAQDSNPIICKVSAVSNDKPIPYEPMGILVALQNTTDTAQKVEITFEPMFRTKYPDLNIKWYDAGEGGEPITFAISPNGTMKRDKIIEGYAFSEPGIKVEIEAKWANISSGFEVSVNVQALAENDKKAYEFLKSSSINIPDGFYNNGLFEDTPENLSAMKKFIKDYSASRYANLARIGLGLLYQRMAEPVFGEYPEGAEKNLKNAKHTFKRIINEYKEKKGEKREVDDEDKEDERDDDNDDRKAAVDKNTFLWASYYLGQLYEEEATKVSKTTEEAQENKEQELLKHALKIYIYALSQEPNEYYKFILTEAKTRVEGEIAQLEKSKKREEEMRKQFEEIEKKLEKEEKKG